MSRKTLKKEFKPFDNVISMLESNQTTSSEYEFDTILSRLNSGKNGSPNVNREFKPFTTIPGWSV